ELAARTWLVSLAHGKNGRHRPAAQFPATALSAFPPLVSPAPAGTVGRPARSRAAPGRLFHDLQRAGDRPGRRGSARTRRLPCRAGEPDVLRPADAQQGPVARSAISHSRAGGGTGCPPG